MNVKVGTIAAHVVVSEMKLSHAMRKKGVYVQRLFAGSHDPKHSLGDDSHEMYIPIFW